MTGLSKIFRAVVLGLACIAGTTAACTKPTAENNPQQKIQTAEKDQISVPSSGDTATEPNDPKLSTYWVVQYEALDQALLDDSRRSEATDGLPVYSVTLSVPREVIDTPFDGINNRDNFPLMQKKNKLLLDFMSQCIGTDNTIKIAQMAEGKIAVYTTLIKLSNTVEITHLAPGQKDFVTDTTFGCQDKEGIDKINEAVSALKTSVESYSR